LGINIPTGKDSLSMKQNILNEEVIAPGTVIITAGGNCVLMLKKSGRTCTSKRR
jgi:phosphoribosylformylglycinamidine synthase